MNAEIWFEIIVAALPQILLAIAGAAIRCAIVIGILVFAIIGIESL